MHCSLYNNKKIIFLKYFIKFIVGQLQKFNKVLKKMISCNIYQLKFQKFKCTAKMLIYAILFSHKVQLKFNSLKFRYSSSYIYLIGYTNLISITADLANVFKFSRLDFTQAYYFYTFTFIQSWIYSICY